MNQPIASGTPLGCEQCEDLFDQHLQRLCFLSVKDAGLDRSDVQRYVDGSASEADVIAAVREYADDYGLEVAGRGWVG